MITLPQVKPLPNAARTTLSPVSVKDLVIHPREHDLIIGTFGRAAWVLDDIRPLREIAKNNTVYLLFLSKLVRTLQ